MSTYNVKLLTEEVTDLLKAYDDTAIFVALLRQTAEDTSAEATRVLRAILQKFVEAAALLFQAVGPVLKACDVAADAMNKQEANDLANMAKNLDSKGGNN